MATSEKTIDRVIFESDGTFKELAAPPTNPPTDYARLYRGTDGKWYSVNSGGVVSPLGSGGSITPVEQTAHGFLATEIGAPLRMSGGNWVKAQANMANTAEAFVLLYRVIDVNNIEVISGGEVSGILAGVFEENELPAVDSLLWLSAAQNGKLTITKPNVWGYITKPLGVVTGSGKIIFANMRADVAGNSNAQFTVALSNNAMTQAVYVGDMQGGTIKGDIVVAATTPLVGHYEIMFSKNGAGVYQASVALNGDVVATDIQMANNGWLQITLGNNTGFTSGRFNYSINAPSAGASLVGTISESKLVPDGGSIGQAETITATGTYTRTATSPRKVFIELNAPTAATNFDLPTGAAIQKGYDVLINVGGTTGATENNPVIVRTAAGVEIDRIGGNGFIHVMARVNNPSAVTDWKVVDFNDSGFFTPSWAFSGGNGTISQTLFIGSYIKGLSSVSFTIRATGVAKGTASGILRFALPSSLPLSVNNSDVFYPGGVVYASNITKAAADTMYFASLVFPNSRTQTLYNVTSNLSVSTLVATQLAASAVEILTSSTYMYKR
jgi:hypothetical protein